MRQPEFLTIVTPDSLTGKLGYMCSIVDSYFEGGVVRSRPSATKDPETYINNVDYSIYSPDVIDEISRKMLQERYDRLLPDWPKIKNCSLVKLFQYDEVKPAIIDMGAPDEMVKALATKISIATDTEVYGYGVLEYGTQKDAIKWQDERGKNRISNSLRQAKLEHGLSANAPVTLLGDRCGRFADKQLLPFIQRAVYTQEKPVKLYIPDEECEVRVRRVINVTDMLSKVMLATTVSETEELVFEPGTNTDPVLTYLTAVRRLIQPTFHPSINRLSVGTPANIARQFANDPINIYSDSEYYPS